MTGTATETGWLPVTRDDKSAPFFDAAARDVLLIRKCRSCQQLSAPETTTCGACGSTDLDWVEATGNGQLVSWTVVHRPPIPAFADNTPYVLGLIELEEGPWIHSRLRGVDPAQLTAGADLSVMFVSPADSERYPVFTVRYSRGAPSGRLPANSASSRRAGVTGMLSGTTGCPQF